MRTVAVSGASGKTGRRIAEELLSRDIQPRLLLRPDSDLPLTLDRCEQHRLSLFDREALDQSLAGVDALVIATGARPTAIGRIIEITSSPELPVQSMADALA